MTNALSLRDIAAIVSNHANMDISAVLKTMELGCRDLDFNKAVLNFALAQRSQGRRTAIVTANMDVFSDVVVPVWMFSQMWSFQRIDWTRNLM